MGLASLWLLPLLLGFSLANTRNCDVEINITCDSGGNVSLDTSDFYEKYQNCDWSFKDKGGVTRDVPKPSQRVNAQCNWSEIDLNMHCINPQYKEIQACYKFERNSRTQAPLNARAIPHHIQVAVITSVFLCLWCLMCLL